MSNIRCIWAGDTELYQAYHDREWGVPVHDDRLLFEFLILEGAQAGLSWITILKKRDAYRAAFDNFEVARVASYDADKIASLMQNAGIVRNRLKIQSAILNAQKFLAVQKEFGNFDRFIWSFVQGKTLSPCGTLQNRWSQHTDIPSKTAESDAMSKALQKRGFKFVGSTICYAYMQAVGMVNDHTNNCFRYLELKNNFKHY